MASENLGDIATFRLGLQASGESVGSPMIRVGDLRGPIDWDSVARTTSPKVAERLLLDGDVLIARSGDGSAGRLEVVSDPPHAATFASYVIRIRPGAGWDGRYLAYWLKTTRLTKEISGRIVGTPIPNISIDRLETLPIKAAPLESQIKIGRRLHAAYLAMSETKRNVSQALDRLETITSAQYPLLQEAWGSNHPIVGLLEVSKLYDTERQPLNATERAGQPGATPYYGASGVIDHVDGWTHSGKFVLLSEDGNNLRTRRTPIAFVATGRFWANNHVHVLSPDTSRVLPEYLALAIDSSSVERYLTGSAQPKLNQKALASITIPLPPIAEQHSILRQYQGARDQLAELRGLGSRILSDLNNAWMSLLDEVFRDDALVNMVAELDAKQAAAWLRSPELKEYLAMSRPRTQPVKSTGWADNLDRSAIPIEEVFHERQDSVDPDMVDEQVDEFFEWLREETSAGRLVIQLEDDAAYIRFVR